MKIGDRVEVVDDAVSGIITGVSENNVTIKTNDDFELQYPKNELVVIPKALEADKNFSKDLLKNMAEKVEKRPKKVKRVKPKERNLPPMVVDLHIHQLVKDDRNLSNFDMLNIQIDTAKRQLDFAIKKRIQRVVFIHGIGQGVLREELEYLFRRYDQLKYYDADLQKYGRGATEVYIFQNTSPSEH
ncbi:Smr/MutS family protein [Constantimarinum furrinae]|uniref:Smr domain-containing protein n=1 Tax=Constantimarinum furrinae TaxID=2562285 RepID=A0A7G8PX35_9FLAO|nr:Smr/MutS family protein [Constantimarinum furrinae]QNJ98901.1 Smr domain-containing protein [Constantimarinum furrinae]